MANTKTFLIHNVNPWIDGGFKYGYNVLLKNGRIEKISARAISSRQENLVEINGTGKYLIPGGIDDQVHFRTPGLEQKGTIKTESQAAVAGGITSYIDQPNTNPTTTTWDLWHQKNAIASKTSLANYAFNFGVTNDNLAAIILADPKVVPGIKMFMGSSTGNMGVTDITAENVFKHALQSIPVITHCEDDKMIAENLKRFIAEYGEDIPAKYHPNIRSREACFASTKKAHEWATFYGTRWHCYHISTKEEIPFFESNLPLAERMITAEACIHHITFVLTDYLSKGKFIKWNPAVKTIEDVLAIIAALEAGTISIIATDHAPHTLEEKAQVYTKSPSGAPLVQHAIARGFEMEEKNQMNLKTFIKGMCENPAILFRIKERGFIREGYHADLALVEQNHPWTVKSGNILYKCGWSPFEGHTFNSRVTTTFVGGHKAFWIEGEKMHFDDSQKGAQLVFDRK